MSNEPLINGAEPLARDFSIFAPCETAKQKGLFGKERIMQVDRQVRIILVGSVLALGVASLGGNRLWGEEPSEKLKAPDSVLTPNDHGIAPTAIPAKDRLQARRVDNAVAASFTLPKRAVLNSRQQEAYDNLKDEQEPALRQALDDAAQAKTAEQRKQAATALRDVRAAIRKGIQDILAMSRHKKTGPQSSPVASETSAPGGYTPQNANGSPYAMPEPGSPGPYSGYPGPCGGYGYSSPLSRGCSGVGGYTVVWAWSSSRSKPPSYSCSGYYPDYPGIRECPFSCPLGGGVSGVRSGRWIFSGYDPSYPYNAVLLIQSPGASFSGVRLPNLIRIR